MLAFNSFPRFRLDPNGLLLPSKIAGEVKYPVQRSIEDVFLGK
jgi:hypothetical protein